MIEFVEITFAGIIGACFGSFITMASWRLPQEGSLLKPPSHCPKCKNNLKAIDLIPIVSWFLTKGKCRYCGAGIGVRYVLTEIITTTLFVLHYIKFGFGVEFFIFGTLAVALMIMIVADFETYIIPDTSIILMIIGAVAYRYFYELSWIDMAIGATMGLFISLGLQFVFKKLLKKDALGFGDVKFMAVAGMWLGFFPMPFFFIIGGLLGVMTGIVWQNIFKKEMFPFGPALAVSLYLLVIFPEIYSFFLQPK